MDGAAIIEAVRRELIDKHDQKGTDREVAEYLGLSIPAIGLWKKQESVTVRQIVGLLKRAKRSAEKQLKRHMVRTVVEFFEIDKFETKGGAGLEIFRVTVADRIHPYRRGLKAQLEGCKGVYIFYDSRGRALYAGKTLKLNLWKEINNAFNRNRETVQKIRKVDHPERHQEFKTAAEKMRPIRERGVPLSELAVYFSAYEVVDEAINDVEALLIRGFPNDLLNIRMENLSKEQPTAP